MAQYFSNVRVDLDRLSDWTVKRIPRTEHIQANALDGIATALSIKETVLLPIYLQATSLIAIALVCSTNKTNDNWMNKIEAYIRTKELPEDNMQAHKIRIQDVCFTLIGDSLYKRYFGDHTSGRHRGTICIG